MSRADELAWEAYVRGELARFYDACGGVTYLWARTPGAVRALARRGVSELRGDSELAAFRGPWHEVRPHVTREFRQWVEEDEGTRRMTPAQFVAAQRAGREAEAWEASADATLDRLAELTRLMSERDALIVEACKRGASKVAVGAAAGLSRQQVHVILTKAAEAERIAPVTRLHTVWVDLPDGGSMEVEVEIPAA